LLFAYSQCCYLFFGSKNKLQKNILKKYLKKIQKIIKTRKWCWNAEKKIKLVEKVQKCKKLKFDSIFLTDESPVDKENSSWGKKSLQSDVYGFN
jgi:hypothetical protein